MGRTWEDSALARLGLLVFLGHYPGIFHRQRDSSPQLLSSFTCSHAAIVGKIQKFRHCHAQNIGGVERRGVVRICFHFFLERNDLGMICVFFRHFRNCLVEFHGIGTIPKYALLTGQTYCGEQTQHHFFVVQWETPLLIPSVRVGNGKRIIREAPRKECILNFFDIMILHFPHSADNLYGCLLLAELAEFSHICARVVHVDVEFRIRIERIYPLQRREQGSFSRLVFSNETGQRANGEFPAVLDVAVIHDLHGLQFHGLTPLFGLDSLGGIIHPVYFHDFNPKIILRQCFISSKFPIPLNSSMFSTKFR